MPTFSFDAQLVGRPKRSALRAARRAMAVGCANPRDLRVTHTREFELRDGIGDAVWAHVRAASHALRGYGAPSMFDVVMTAHANGFRLFASGAERTAWSMKARLAASGFDPAAAAAFPECKCFTAQSLAKVLSTVPRKVGKETDAAVLAERLARSVGAPRPGGEQSIPPVLADAAERIAHAFPTWSEMTADLGAAATLIDAAIKMSGLSLPRLASALVSHATAMPPGVGEVSLRFDPQAAVIADSDPTARFAGVIARYLPEAGGVEHAGVVKGLQALITTSNANGLSWLFGVGRRALRDDEALPALREAFNASSAEGIVATRRLAEAMKALPPLKALGERVYADARAALQGTLDSLIAAYTNRLVALRASVRASDTTPPSILREPSPTLYAGLPFTADDVARMYLDQPKQAATAAAALRVLSGESPPGEDGYAAAIAEVETYHAWLGRAGGVLRTLLSRLQLRNAPPPFELPDWLNGVDRPVRMRLPGPSPEDLYPSLFAECVALRTERDAVVGRLIEAYAIGSEALRVAGMNMVRRDEAVAEARGRTIRTSTETYRQRGMRVLLDRLLREVRKASPRMWPVAFNLLKAQGLAGQLSERSLKAYLYGGQGQIYLSPMSSRSTQVRIEADGLDALDIGALAEGVIAHARQEGWLRDQVLLEGAWLQVQCMALPERVSAALLPAAPEQAGVPWAPLTVDDAGTVSRSEALKVLNARFASPLSGLLYQLNRTRFVETHDLRCWVGTTVLFAPKAGTWSAPVQYGYGKFAPFLATAVRTDSGAIDVVPTARAWATQAASLSVDAKKPLLRLIGQLPHDWVVTCDFDGACVQEGLVVSGGTLEKTWVKRTGYRLVCPPHFERELSEAFLDRYLSPHSLKFERELQWDGDAITEVGRRVVAHVPIGTTTPPGTPWEPKALMGVDLGEAGMGITVRPLDGGEEIRGFVQTKRLRKVVRSVEHFRRRQQPRQSFRATHSDSLDKAAKAAVGEYCGIIDTLMLAFQAVPVFESDVTKAKGSTPMVPRVFEQVVAHYCYVASPATAESARLSHWYGATRFAIPGWSELRPEVRRLPAEQRAAVKPENARRPWQTFPGVMASGYATSLECSCCGRNALNVLAVAASQGQLQLVTDEGGIACITADGVTHAVAIEAPSTGAAVIAAARKRRRRAPYVRLGNTSWTLTSKADLAAAQKMLRIAIRRDRAELGGTRAHGSVFVCPFRDCAAELDADVNASTVLVRRYHKRLVSEQPDS